MWCCVSLGEGQCGQHVAIPLTILMWSVLFSVVQGAAPFSLHFSKIFSVMSCPVIVVICSCEREQSQERPMPHLSGFTPD